jgi:hypothetical protein
MLIVTEKMFRDVMGSAYPLSFSQEALELIHQYFSQEKSCHTEFRPMDIDINFNEESYFDCVENNDVPIEGLEEASSEFERIEIVKEAISTFLEEKGTLVGFTSRHTVVYKTNR